MTHTVAALFDSHRTADLVVEHLVQEYGISRDRVRVYAEEEGEARSPQDSDQEASLSDLGFPDENVRAYAEAATRGAVLVAAQVEADRLDRILAAYREYGATKLEVREAEWRGKGSTE